MTMSRLRARKDRKNGHGVRIPPPPPGPPCSSNSGGALARSVARSIATASRSTRPFGLPRTSGTNRLPHSARKPPVHRGGSNGHSLRSNRGTRSCAIPASDVINTMANANAETPLRPSRFLENSMCISTLDSGITVELTRWREFNQASPDQSSYKTRSRRSRPTTCSTAFQCPPVE
jgi:hypothetical protein